MRRNLVGSCTLDQMIIGKTYYRVSQGELSEKPLIYKGAIKYNQNNIQDIILLFDMKIDGEIKIITNTIFSGDYSVVPYSPGNWNNSNFIIDPEKITDETLRELRKIRDEAMIRRSSYDSIFFDTTA